MTDSAEKKITEIKELRDQGLNFSQIAEKLKVTTGTIGYYVSMDKKRSKVGGSKGRKKHAVNGNPSKGNTVSPEEAYLEIQAAYATGKFEEFLRGHAESRRVSFESLTRRVAESLLAITHR
jgi:hypothetical protein